MQRVVARTALAPRTLKRRFKKHVGSSIIDYVQMLRLDAAKDQLVKTATSVEDIAHAIGYRDPSFFRRKFRAATGLTPFQFRERFGEPRNE